MPGENNITSLAAGLLVFCSVGLLSFFLIPIFLQWARHLGERRARNLSEKIDRMGWNPNARLLFLVFFFGPLLGGGTGYLLIPQDFKLAGSIIGAIIGFLTPRVAVNIATARRKVKFEDQLVDALMLMSSSFKGGLSLIQAMEVAVEEMPPPLNQELSIVLGENKIGVPMEESFNHLLKRMPSAALYQMITAILLARETGGNLPVIFSRIVATIRENKRIQQSIDTLTIQGKLQGIIMSALPILFVAVVYSTNKNFLEGMMQTEIGRMLLMYAAFSECIGAFLIWRISTVKEF